MLRLLFLLLFLTSSASTQVRRYGDFLEYVDSLVSTMPAGTSQNVYQVPSQQYLDSWKTLMTNLLRRNDSLAALQATALSYRLVEFMDTSAGSWTSLQEYRVLEKLPASSNYWGTYAVAVSPLRGQLILQAPHPLNDNKTGLQSAYVFRAVRALAFFLSGTHRCNNSSFSPCSGTTSTCSGTNEPYRISDVAHATNSPFHAAAVAAEEELHPFAVQLHGFAKGETDPDLIMSNSTALAPPTDFLAQLRDALLVSDNTLTFKIAHTDAGWTRLTGTTNVQGRMINGSADPCAQASPANIGRFFHIEQAYPKLRSDATGWQKMASALAAVFPATNAVPDERTSPNEYRLLQNYPNPFNPSTILSFSIPRESFVRIDVVDISGRLIETLVSGVLPTGDHSVRWEAGVSAGVYFARMRATSRGGTGTSQLVGKLVLTR